MWNYVFGRLMYNFIRGIWKSFYYLFVGITYIMFYSVYYSVMAFWIFCKFIAWCFRWYYVGIKKMFKFTVESLIKLKELIVNKC